MSMFENDKYRWRETYFVLFEAAKRPTAKQIQKTIEHLDDRFALDNLQADDEGRFESMTLLAPDDFAALDVCYVEGDEVTEHAAELADDMKTALYEAADKEKIKRIRHCDARFDLLHFEQLSEAIDEDEEEEMLDPGSMLLVMEALARLTGGIAVDPQSGTIV